MPVGYPKDGAPRIRKLRPDTRCQVCRHPERMRIEALHVAGVALDKIACKFNVHRDAIWRHVQRHMSDEQKAGYLVGPARIAELAEIAAEENSSVLDYLRILRATLVAQLDRLAQRNDHQGIATISTPLLNCLKALGKVTGEISQIASSTIVNVHNNTTILNSQPFSELQAGLLQICAKHPDARQDIVQLFRQLDAKYSAAPIEARPVREVGEAANV